MNFAVFDFAISFLAMYFIAPYLSKLFKKIGVEIPEINWLFLTIPISILIHSLVGANTPLTKNFLDSNGHYITKLVIVILLILGLYGIKFVKK